MMQNLLDDPNDVGMMSLGLRLLSTPGKFGQALGTAGLGAMGDMQQQKQVQAMARQRMQQEEMQRMQLDQIKRQQAEQERLRQRQMGVENAYRGAMESPAQQALAQGGGPTVGNAQAMQGMAPRINQQKLIASLMAEDPIMAAQMMQPKPDELMTVAPGSTVLNKRDPTKPLFTAPSKADADKEVDRLKLIYGDGTPAYRAALAKLGEKMTSHAPAASATAYGSPVPIQLPDGSVGYAQPGNRPGAPPQLMNDPGTGKPLTKPPGAEAAPTEDERKAAGWVSQAETAWTNMRSAAFDANGALKPDAKPGVLETMIPGENAKNLSRSAGRQKFVQSASSLSESLLRAATGAGVNKDEAEQKVRELTPQPFDLPEVITQKMNAIPPYLQSLRTRASRALPKNLPPVAPVPGPDKPKAKFLGFE